MTEAVTVIRPGSKIKTPTGYDGVILNVAVSLSGHVRYELSWWDGADRKTDWFYESEFECVDRRDLAIGFR